MVTTLADVKQLLTPVFKILFKQLKLFMTNYNYLKYSLNLESDLILALSSSADCRAALGWIACVMACSHQAWSISTLNNGQIQWLCAKINLVFYQLEQKSCSHLTLEVPFRLLSLYKMPKCLLLLNSIF